MSIQIDPQEAGLVSAQTAAAFLKRSQLSNQQLARVRQSVIVNNNTHCRYGNWPIIIKVVRWTN
jgi:hypothetical protein